MEGAEQQFTDDASENLQLYPLEEYPDRRKVFLDESAEENAATLQFGSAFADAEPLLNAEVAIILEHTKQQKEEQKTAPSAVFDQAFAYVKEFSRHENHAAVQELREALQQTELEPFERAAMGNLAPGSATEAKALIPSLTRFPDDQLQEILDRLPNLEDA